MTTIKYQKDMSKEISMKEELTQEIQKLKHFIAKSKRDSEITHSELNAALKSLSTRSDLHSELLSCRQELASEKLVSQGLRVNCELQRSVLEEERAKNILLKQELHEVTNTLQSIQMTNSIENIPGANPLEVMKLFSGRIVWLENELKAFQRRESNMVALSQISSEQSSYANKQVKSIKSRNKIERPQSKEGVIDFLNDALHAQMLNHQETVIAEQKEKISQLEQEISRMILDVDVFSIENETECGLGVQWQKLKLERDASEKRLELLNQQLEASKSEIATLRITIVSLEKKLQANESRQNLDYRNSFDLHPTTDVNQQQSLEDKEANQTLHDLLQERTYQVKVLMESLETIQTNEVTNSKKLAFTDAAHYDKGDIPYQPAAAHGSSSLIKRIVDLSVEMASQSTLCFAAERRCDQLENIVVHKSKEITDLKNNISRLTTELTSLRRQHVEQFSSFSEKSENQSSEIFDLKEQICKLQEIIVEYETKCGDLEVSQNELFAQAELADRAAFQKWFLENLVPTEFDDTHSSDLSPAIYDQRAHLSKSDQHKSVEDLVVKLLVQWREQVGFYPRGASGPISKAEEKFLNQITSLVLEAHQVSKNATIESIRSRNEADKSSRLYHRLIKRYEIAVREIYSLRSRLEVSEKILLIDQLYALRGNGKLCNFLTSKLESMTTKLSECRKQLEVAVKQNDQLKLQLNDSNSTNDGLQIKIANLEAFGLNYYRLRDEAIEFAEKSIEQFEKNLKTWFKAEFPRIASGFPIAEMDLQFDWNCNYLEDGGESPFESRSVRMQATGPQSQITIAHALLESRVSNSKTIMLKQNWRDKELLYKERIYHLESIINQWQQSHIPVVKDTDIRNIFENADSIELLSVQNQRLEELCSQLKNSNDHLTDRCNLMKGMIDELKKAERELNLHYADKITEQAKNLESRHAVELKDLREAYEKEKISIVEEIYKVSTNVEGPVLTEETMYELLPTKVPASIELNFNDSTHTDNDTRNSHAQPQQPQQMSQATSKHKVVEITSPSRKPSTPATLNPSKTNQKKENNDLNELIGKYNALLQEYQLEKEGNSQMKLQVAELEQLLESQRLSFLRHLEIEKNFVNSSCAVPSNGSNVSTNGSLDAVTVDTEPLQLTEESSSSRVDCDIKSVESMLEVLTCHSAEINVKMTELIKCLQTYSINDTLADQITESIRMIRNVAEEFNSVLQKVSHNVSELPDSNHHHKIEKNDDELHARLQLYENLLSELRVENTSNMNNLKTKYEAALQDLQGMMNEQLTVAKMEIDRLQNALSLGSPTAAAVMVDSFSQTDFVEEKHEHLKTILELQRLLDSAADEIDNYKLREKVLTSELLQHQERENRENAVKNQNPQANENVKQLESKLGELTRMCEEKTIELKQLLKATSLVDRKDPTFPFDATIIQQPTFNDQASAVINEQLREQLRQANSQIETLTKKISTLEQDEKRRREFGNVDIENRTRLQRSREVESMKTEIQKLRDEKVNFKQILDEYKAQVNGLREENTRKIGLITSLKSARESDLNALETWKHNLSEMEEKNKRLQRALQSKEEIVKDLKQKMTALETSAVVQQESDGSDLTTLTISQLRTRVKAAELERGRARARISAYREKVDELEANIRKLQQEIEHCKGFEDKCEILKQNIVRKDSQIKSLHEQVEKLKVDNLANKEITTTRISDLERMLRNARRQIEASESKQEEYQQKILDVKNDHLSKVDELRRECSSLEVLNANLKSQVASLSSHLKSDSERALGVGGGEGESFHHDRISTSELEDIISAISVDSKESRSTRYRSELKDATKLKEAEDSLKSLLQFVT